jgi:Ca2+-binding EF-hand superfamily protein
VKKDTGAGINELKSEVLNTQETQACVLYLLVRGFEFELRSSRNHLDLISLKALKSPDDDVTQIEMDIVGSINRAKTEIQQCLMLKRTHDNKEIYSCNFGSSQGRNGGSGFLILSLLNRVKAGFNRETLRLEEEVRKALTFLNSLPDTSKSINSLNSSSFTLICISMIICGYKKEFLKVENQKEILKEFLKGNVTRRIIQLDWTDRKIWAATLRARAHIKSCLGDNPVGKISQIDAMRSRTAESTVNPFSTMLEYILTAVAATRYFKWLDEIDKSKKNFLDLSAIVLQCSYRAFRSIKLLEKLRREFKAARIIQCAFRQLLARRKLYYLKVTKAASTIQQAFRRKIDRRKGKKTKKIVEELYELSNSLGGISPVGILSEKSRSVTWKTDTTYFDSFEAFLKSRLGRDEIKKEEAVAGERFHSLAKQREGLSTEDRLVLEVMDLFEIYDNARTGCITREATRDLMARLRCPLDPAELDDIIDMIDDDKSGDISFKEFISWYSHEYSLMRSRSKDVGLLSKKDRAWFIESAAEISLRKRWEEQKNNAKLAQSSTE